MEKVVLRHCAEYTETEVRDAVKVLLEPLGGISRFVQPGQRVLLKPNMLAGKSPEAAVTTHPLLVQIVGELVVEAGGVLIVGDSPGIGSFDRIAGVTGIAAATQVAGGRLRPFQTSRRIAADGRFRQLELAEEFLDADVVINLPKLKTHEMMTLTCGVKNLYGTIVGTAKAGLHLTAGHSKELFAGLLLEIAGARQVALTIVDGITAMEGNGPSSGAPRQFGLLIAGTNLVAVDTVAAYLAGIPPALLPVEQEARRLGLAGTDLEQIELAGDTAAFVAASPAFRLPDGLDTQFGLPDFVKRILRNQLTPLPVAETHCTRCGVCRDACPPAAITITENALKVDSGRCIRCWCCRELCPQHAMGIHKGGLLRLVEKLA